MVRVDDLIVGANFRCRCPHVSNRYQSLQRVDYSAESEQQLLTSLLTSYAHLSAAETTINTTAQTGTGREASCHVSLLASQVLTSFGQRQREVKARHSANKGNDAYRRNHLSTLAISILQTYLAAALSTQTTPQ